MNKYLITALSVLTLAGCGAIPSSGPSRAAIFNSNYSGSEAMVAKSIEIVDVNESVIQQLLAQRKRHDFSTMLGTKTPGQQFIGKGDTLQVSIWEAPPVTLFGSSDAKTRSLPSSAHITTLPDQMVNRQGKIDVPFAGEIQAAGKTPQQVEAEIVKRLHNTSKTRAMVLIANNASANVTVVGEVTKSIRMPVTPAGEHLLDALAAAGGVRQPVGKVTIQLTRNDKYFSMPLDNIIRDPEQNIPLYPGDVVTALYQPLSFNALGATGKSKEINFETQGISLAQGLARAGGLDDNRADVQGVFIFRFEPKDALKWPNKPVLTTPDGKVPVIYRFDFKDTASFFIAQSFILKNSDVVYVSDAPVAQLQKFFNLVFSIVFPISTATTIRF
ncbi:MAG TPA: polysaccharide biosynthesis/export family protein [Burkholderiales bacterium]|nr:polysaccharide biosynthesis/export family protein [Burkholderiales bacterium]